MPDDRTPTLYELVAIAGAALLMLAVALVPGDLRRASLDAVIVFTPLALVCAYPLMRRLGVARLPWYSVELPGLAFIAVALVSVAVAAPTIGSLLTVARYTTYLLIVPAVGAIALLPQARRFLLWVIGLGGSATFVYAVYQWVSPSRAIGVTGLDPEVSTRVFATFINPNFYAEYLVLLFGVLLALVLTEKHFARFVAVVLLVGCSAVLLLTYTRGSWLALAIGLLIAVGMVNIRLVWPIIGVGAVGVVLVPGVLQRVLSIFTLEGTASFRLQLWRIAGEAIRAHPFFGVGPGNFTEAFRAVVESQPELSVGYLQYGAHNSLLTVTAETGLLGGIAFVWLVFSLARTGLRIGSREGLDHGDQLVNAALTASLIAFALNALTSNAFQHPQAAVTFFFIAGLQAGLGMKYIERPHEVVRPRPAVATHPLLDGSLVVTAMRAVSSFLRDAWHESGVRRLILAPPPFGGDIIAGSRVGRALFGSGTARATAEA